MNTNQARNWQQHSAQPDIQKKVLVKVRKKSWLTKGEKVIYAFLSTAVLLTGIYIVSYSSSVDTLNRDIQTLEMDIEAQKTENESLLNETRELSKSKRITDIARENGLKIQDTQVMRATN